MNSFEGVVPTEGIFQNANSVSVSGNIKLRGGVPPLHLKPCSIQEPTKVRRHSSVRKIIAIGLSVAISSLLLVFLVVISLCWYGQRQKNDRANDDDDLSTSPVKHSFEKISYGELYSATSGFSSSNLLGSGNFGSVYKGFLGLENKVIAVKVLNLRKRGAAKSFMAECEALRGIRHRNLAKLVTACSSIDFKGNEFRALVYEFMPNGSLHTWLHREEVEGIENSSRPLTLVERLNIAIDVASALVYLHSYGHDYPIAHCDLKPSNILLDEDLVAHIGDFGLAQILLKFDRETFRNQLSSAGIRGTIGYAAPEYGMGGEPSTTDDVYSFGIFLLEMFTGKRPTDKSFFGDTTLHSFTKLALQEQVLDIADQSIFLFGDTRIGSINTSECLKLVFEVGIKCSEESPMNRMKMDEALKELVSVKEKFFRHRR